MKQEVGINKRSENREAVAAESRRANKKLIRVRAHLRPVTMSLWGYQDVLF